MRLAGGRAAGLRAVRAAQTAEILELSAGAQRGDGGYSCSAAVLQAADSGQIDTNCSADSGQIETNCRY